MYQQILSPLQTNNQSQPWLLSCHVPVEYRSVYALARAGIATPIPRAGSARPGRRPVVHVVHVIVRPVLRGLMVIPLENRERTSLVKRKTRKMRCFQGTKQRQKCVQITLCVKSRTTLVSKLIVVKIILHRQKS